MNVRKQVDYSAMFAALDKLMAADLPQVELYCEIGRLVSGRAEKGAAVAASEYLSSIYPDASGFSPRNLRRMREFYRTYGAAPEVLAETMTIGWTQNVVILEADLTIQEKEWYIQAVRQFGWTKLALLEKIEAGAHRDIILDNVTDPCYSGNKGGEENGAQKSSGTLLQNLRDAKVQRELQRKGPCSPYLQDMRTLVTSTAGRTDDAPPPGKSAATPSQQKRDDLAEESNARPPARSAVSGLRGLCGEIPSGVVQDTASADEVPDHVADLLLSLMEFFE